MLSQVGAASLWRGGLPKLTGGGMMKCIVCGRKMKVQVEYVQVGIEHQLVTRAFWQCPCCQTRTAGELRREGAAPSQREELMR